MATGGIVEYFPKDPNITYTVPSGQTVTGGDAVVANGTSRQCVRGGANAVNALGVALYNADGSSTDPNQTKVSVANAGVWPMRASGAINAGDFVKTGANGTVVAVAADGDPRLIIGQAIDDIADTALGPIRLML